MFIYLIYISNNYLILKNIDFYLIQEKNYKKVKINNNSDFINITENRLNQKIYFKSINNYENNITIIKTKNGYVLEGNNYINHCNNFENSYIVKIKENVYNIFILNDAKINFKGIYKPMSLKEPLQSHYCKIDLKFSINNIFQSNDIVYIFDKNKVVKKIALP